MRAGPPLFGTLHVTLKLPLPGTLSVGVAGASATKPVADEASPLPTLFTARTLKLLRVL